MNYMNINLTSVHFYARIKIKKEVPSKWRN